MPAGLTVDPRFAFGDVDGDGIPDLVSAGGVGAGPVVRAASGATGRILWEALPYEIGFLGGVELATGDFNGDGRADVLTGAGPGALPHATVIDGATGRVIRSWLAFDAGFRGGIWVAAGDVSGDGRADAVIGARAGAGPHVAVFDGSDEFPDGAFWDFYSFDVGFLGGVRVAAGDMTGDGRADVIVGAGPGAGPHVAAFDAVTGRVVHSYFAYEPEFRGGVRVAAGDVDGNGLDDAITVPGAGGAAHVTVFSGRGSRFFNFFAADPSVTAGATIGAADLDNDGFDDVIAGTAGRVLAFRGLDALPLWELGVAADGLVAPESGFAAEADDYASRVFDGRTVFVAGSPGAVAEVRFVRHRQDADSTQSETGLFAVDDATGRIGGLSPGDPGYARRALASDRRIALFGANSPAGVTAALGANRHYGLYRIRGASAAAWLAAHPGNDDPVALPAAWFSFAPANPDGFDHVRLAPRNRFAFEDAAGGGDEDFNDVLIEIRPPAREGGQPPAPANTAPTISSVADQIAERGAPVGPIGFRVADRETPGERLTVTAASSAPSLLPVSGIVAAGAGGGRMLILTPAAGASGTARVTLRVTDTGGGAAETSFDLVVRAGNWGPAFRTSPPLHAA